MWQGQESNGKPQISGFYTTNFVAEVSKVSQPTAEELKPAVSTRPIFKFSSEEDDLPQLEGGPTLESSQAQYSSQKDSPKHRRISSSNSH